MDRARVLKSGLQREKIGVPRKFPPEKSNVLLPLDRPRSLRYWELFLLSSFEAIKFNEKSEVSEACVGPDFSGKFCNFLFTGLMLLLLLLFSRTQFCSVIHQRLTDSFLYVLQNHLSVQALIRIEQCKTGVKWSVSNSSDFFLFLKQILKWFVEFWGRQWTGSIFFIVTRALQSRRYFCLLLSDYLRVLTPFVNVRSVLVHFKGRSPHFTFYILHFTGSLIYESESLSARNVQARLMFRSSPARNFPPKRKTIAQSLYCGWLDESQKYIFFNSEKLLFSKWSKTRNYSPSLCLSKLMKSSPTPGSFLFYVKAKSKMPSSSWFLLTQV